MSDDEDLSLSNTQPSLHLRLKRPKLVRDFESEQEVDSIEDTTKSIPSLREKSSNTSKKNDIIRVVTKSLFFTTILLFCIYLLKEYFARRSEERRRLTSFTSTLTQENPEGNNDFDTVIPLENQSATNVDTLNFENITSDEERREIVKNAFIHAWNGYETFAFGHDEVRPLTNDVSNLIQKMDYFTRREIILEIWLPLLLTAWIPCSLWVSKNHLKRVESS